MNVCGACNRDFSSVESFDAHRVGKHAYTVTQGLRMNPPRDDGRRCLYDHEIVLRFDRDAHGRLALRKRKGRAARHFSARTPTS